MSVKATLFIIIIIIFKNKKFNLLFIYFYGDPKIKYTKLSPIMSKTVPSLVESPYCRTLENIRATSAGVFLLLFVCLIWGLGSHHLVIY